MPPNESEEVSILAADALSLLLSTSDESLVFWNPRSVNAAGKIEEDYMSPANSRMVFPMNLMPNTPVTPTTEKKKFGEIFLQKTLQALALSTETSDHFSRVKKLKLEGQLSLDKEKRRVKDELRRYDNEYSRKFGCLPSKHDKEPLRPVYNYYRVVKTTILELTSSLQCEPSRPKVDKYDYEIRLQQEMEILNSEAARVRNLLKEFHKNFERKYGRCLLTGHNFLQENQISQRHFASASGVLPI